MANLKILTENEAGDGWIDNLPSSATTGYQAQNTNITASRLGFDICSLSVGADNVVVDGNSGIIDVNGVPFVMIEAVNIAKTNFAVGVTYLKLVAVSTTEMNIETITVAPTWNSVKQYFETSAGERVLSWKITNDGTEFCVERFEHGNKSTPDLQIGIGKGEKQEFETVGAHSTIIRDSGIYSIWIIAGGGATTVPTLGTGTIAGGGGGCSRADLFLLAGQKVTFTVGSALNSSSAIVANRLTMLAQPYASGTSTVSVTGAYQRKNVYIGGAGGSVAIDSGGIFGTVYPGGKGGGAGPNGSGNSGYGIHKTGTTSTVTKINGACAIGKAGLGESGIGFACIEYLGK